MVEKLLPEIFRAALEHDDKTLRILAMRVIRRVKNEYPNISTEIARALDYNGIGINARRSVGIEPAPVDIESQLSIARVEEPIAIDRPVFNDKVNSAVDMFISERNNAVKLIEKGVEPSSKILFIGAPGVGKTHLAKHLAYVLGMKIVTIDLAYSISSFLGKTGQNIKSIFDYAKKDNAILFLDEFDSIAKKRDDSTDLGELKRIVNVLLKEIDDWTSNSIIIAATNHPQLLDLAIWRRFDMTLNIDLPGYDQREKIIKNAFEKDAEDITNIKFLTTMTENLSGSDIVRIIESSKRKAILTDINLFKAFLEELPSLCDKNDIKFNKKFAKFAHEEMKMPYAQIAGLLGKSKSAVQYYLKGGK